MIFHNLKEIFQNGFYIPLYHLPFKNEDLRIFRTLKKVGSLSKRWQTKRRNEFKQEPK